MATSQNTAPSPSMDPFAPHDNVPGKVSDIRMQVARLENLSSKVRDYAVGPQPREAVGEDDGGNLPGDLGWIQRRLNAIILDLDATANSLGCSED